MSKAIYKYPINVSQSFMLPGFHEELLIPRVQVPKGAQFLSIGNQREELVSWFMVDTEEQLTESKSFVLLATGAVLSEAAQDHLDERFRFVDTVLFGSGSFVLHVFRRAEDA